MSIKSKIYKYINTRTPEETIFIILVAFSVGSIITLLVSFVAYAVIIGLVLYVLHYISSHYNITKDVKEEKPKRKKSV